MKSEVYREVSAVDKEIQMPPDNRKSPKNIKKPNKFQRFTNSQQVVPYIFALPFILSFLLLTLYPTFKAINMSFHRILPGESTFIGLENYKRILNPTFLKALTNTTIYVFLTVLILTVVPIILATLLNSKFVRFKSLFRASLFIPSLTSVIVAGTIFRLMFGESDVAVANQIIDFLGFDTLNWRFERWTAMFLMVLLCCWRWMGVNIIYFLAGLQNIPEELYEASDIDGAGVFQKFRHITLPHLRPITIFVVTISIINGFRMFEESFVFWETNSPGNIGLTVVGYIYQQGIEQNNMGFGSAVGVVLMVIIFVISLVQLSITGAFKRGDS